MKVVDLFLILISVKGFYKILSVWNSMEVYLGLVWVTISAGYLLLINYFKDVRDWIRKSDKHKFCFFICYLKQFDVVLRNNMCAKRNCPWSWTGSACYVYK